MHTYQSALALADVTVPAHLLADAEVPILTGPQAQGDLLIWPVKFKGVMEAVTRAGVQVVRGEATGHTHWLHQGFDSPGVRWARNPRYDGSGDLVMGWVDVPGGQSAQVIHTDEHGANGVGPGVYAISGKREQADIIRRVAD